MVETATQAWRAVLGYDRVSIDAKTIAIHENATFATHQSVIAVLTPHNREEVQECVRIANLYETPIYPVSKGKNWGYGSAVPVTDRCAIICLEKMTAITDYSEELAYITVEPGVTFQQVHDFLTANHSKLLTPAIGSTPHASLIGNAVERGIGKGRYGDRFQHSCNMEVVLPSGEVIETGFGNMPGAHSKHTYKSGVGPSIDGIFSQSNFGIVTRMTFWLVPQPGYFQTFFYTVKNTAQLEKVVDALRQLRLEGTLTTTSTLSNDYRIASMRGQFPWDQSDNAGTLPQGYIERIRKTALQGAMWVGDDAILAPTKQQGKAIAKRVREILGVAADKLIFIDSRTATLGEIFHKPIKWLTGVNMKELMYFFHNSLYLGKLMEKQLGMCYWRKKTPVPSAMNLDQDKCGVIWCCPSIPFQGKHVARVLEIVAPIYEKYNFEPNMGLNFMSERNIAYTAAIIYDRAVPGQDEQAMACYKAMMERLKEEGYPSYRLGIQSMDKPFSDSPEYTKLLQKIKLHLDPNNILAPGRYGLTNNHKKSISPKQESEQPVIHSVLETA